MYSVSLIGSGGGGGPMLMAQNLVCVFFNTSPTLLNGGGAFGKAGQ